MLYKAEPTKYEVRVYFEGEGIDYYYCDDYPEARFCFRGFARCGNVLEVRLVAIYESERYNGEEIIATHYPRMTDDEFIKFEKEFKF